MRQSPVSASGRLVLGAVLCCRSLYMYHTQPRYGPHQVLVLARLYCKVIRICPDVRYPVGDLACLVGRVVSRFRKFDPSTEKVDYQVE
jgi:hypothetical protein